MEIESGPDPLADEAVPGAAAARLLIERFPPRLVSALLWRTGPGWSIPRRTLGDALLFVPLAGAIDIEAGGRRARLGPGRIGLFPEGLPHAARLAPGTRRLEVIAVHARILDAVGADALALFAHPAPLLPDAQRWHRRLRNLVALHNRPDAGDRAAGTAVGRVLIADLLAELALGGARIACNDPALDPRIAAAVRAIRDHGADDVAALARAAGLSAVRFRALFGRATGIPPKRYICRHRLALAAERLRQGDDAVKRIADDCGFCSDHYFHQQFRARYGLTPSAFRARERQFQI